MNQGQESNLSGEFLEETVEREFRARRVAVFQYADNGNNEDLFAERFLLRDAPYTSIYGCNSRSEFLYRHRFGFDLRIECKWQQVPGSIDEKLPYLLMNATHAMPEKNIWLIVDGNGARTKAVDWLRLECSRVTAKTIRVYNIIDVRKAIKNLLDQGAA